MVCVIWRVLQKSWNDQRRIWEEFIAPTVHWRFAKTGQGCKVDDGDQWEFFQERTKWNSARQDLQGMWKRRSGHWRYETHWGSPCGGHLHPVQVLWKEIQVKCHSKSSGDIVIFFRTRNAMRLHNSSVHWMQNSRAKKENCYQMFTLEYANLARHGGKPEPALDILCFFQSPKHSSLFSFWFSCPKFIKLYKDSTFIGNWNKWRQKCSSSTLKKLLLRKAFFG